MHELMFQAGVKGMSELIPCIYYTEDPGTYTLQMYQLCKIRIYKL